MSDAISELERLLCDSAALGDIDGLAPRIPDAWTVRFPDLSALPAGAEPWRKLSFCIATEEVAGPIRNGGIGSTYAALAELLAGLGHDTTILYLRGQEIETGDMAQWVTFYAEKGVRFVPVPDFAAQDGFRSHADRWLRAPYNMMRYLQDHPMDVVHVSEWRGCAYFSLLAKRQGVAFADTLFLVKTSSPWMWNRLYGSQPIDRADDLAKVHAERQSVELADVAIGGSLHLLRWMSSQGYRIARDRAFVQPNVVSFENLKDLLGRRSVQRGVRTPFDEIVFFGRLEGRKGLFVFCQAIARMLRMGQALPPKITFMGKAGARLTARPEMSVLDYIAETTRDWPVQVKVLTEFQQYQALEYLLDGPRLAVMPSVIENSSMAIYEAAICGIPCIASNVGGNAELVDKDDWAHVLCEPHPLSLGDKLAEAIALGGYVPRASFDNDANLKTWRDFHDALARGLRERLLSDARLASAGAGSLSLSVCVYATGQTAALRATLESLAAQDAAPAEVIIAVDADRSEQVDEAQSLIAEAGLVGRVIEAFDLDAGAAFNRAARDARGDLLLFVWEGATWTPQGLAVLARVARDRVLDVMTYLHRGPSATEGDAAPLLIAPMITSVADGFFRPDVAIAPLVARRAAFQRLGGFTSDFRTLGYDAELIAKAQLMGMACETVLQPLGAVQGPTAAWLAMRGYDLPASKFRAIRPLLADAPLVLRELLLLGKGLQMRGPGGPRDGVVKPKSERLDPAFEEPFAQMMQAILSPDRPRAGTKRGPTTPGRRK